MKQMSVSTVSVLIFVFLTASLVVVPASSGSELASNHFSFNIQVISLSLDLCFKKTGHLPSSVNELYNLRVLPENLYNSKSGNFLTLTEEVKSDYDIQLNCVSDGYTELITFLPGYGRHVMTFTSDMYESSDLSDADLTVMAYTFWVDYAVTSYHTDNGEFPSTLNDLKSTMYWPFTGMELNPVTMTPLEFHSDDKGNINFRYDGENIRIYGNYENGSRIVLGYPPTEAW